MKKILAMLLVCGTCVFGSMAAQAQTTSGAPAQSARMEHMLEQLQSRFAAANTTHDGKLTQAQAAAGMPMVAQHFDQIDVNKAGYVTLAQIEDYMQQHAAGR
ncbi:EF-hand domain-containing protein [Pararobbsia alpina]|uniref:EF-hand domain-containing protein n=1 Tax=Pararobbsia alpina TaxID=621374 RepID=UPI0039A61540